MQLKNSTIQPRKGHQRDKYEGGLHSLSKLRHGKGVYIYDNPFFSYEGSYEQGKKQGEGELRLKDGTVIKGSFDNNQLNGFAQIQYSHGAIYRGALLYGQKNGQGNYESDYQSFCGLWKDNKKHGKGEYRNNSIGETYCGLFQNDKMHGHGQLKRWNYSYQGQFINGLKQGQGVQINDWSPENASESTKGRFRYEGFFERDLFEGLGKYQSRQSKYVYTGQFTKGQPSLYPNQFRCFTNYNSKNGDDIVQGEKIILSTQAVQYELEGESFNLYIQTVFQGPEQLDEVQPTPEEIDAIVKNWQNENKKNKNPPPMPDFNQPRMKKPEMIVVEQESGRLIEIRLIKQIQGKQEGMKVDYRAEITLRRKQNDQLRIQALKKAEEDGNKKGGKKDNKGEPQLKVNLFNENPNSRQKILKLLTEKGRCKIEALEFPDDFPAGKYTLQISSPFKDFGALRSTKKYINIKAKIAKKK